MPWVIGDPTESGWYATLTCWNPEEGFFSGADRWNGSAWSERSSVVRLFHLKPSLKLWRGLRQMIRKDRKDLNDDPHG